jgi:hypothetical protein
MFNKKLKEEIEGLREEIERLRRNFWCSQYPYGEVGIISSSCSRYTAHVYYKPNHNTEIYLTEVFIFPSIKYFIKKFADKTYLVLESQKRENAEPVDIKQTFVIKNGVAVELDKEFVLDSFDITGTV